MDRTRLRTRTKRWLQSLLPTGQSPIIIASMGRSGSTLVYDAVRNAMADKLFPSVLRSQGLRLVSDNVWDLERARFRNGVVYKTHGLAEELASNENAKVVFLFGSASEAALSVHACRDRYGQAWIKQHFEHLRAKGSFEELGERDVLRFDEQLEGWIGKSGVARMIIHYDALWDNQELLSDFVGATVQLPPRREREGPRAANQAVRVQFLKTYEKLDAKIASLPICQTLF